MSAIAGTSRQYLGVSDHRLGARRQKLKFGMSGIEKLNFTHLHSPQPACDGNCAR